MDEAHTLFVDEAHPIIWLQGQNIGEARTSRAPVGRRPWSSLIL